MYTDEKKKKKKKFSIFKLILLFTCRCVVLLIVYVIFGVVYNAVHNKASGSALFTHVIVWKALPGLVKVRFTNYILI